MKIIIKSSFDSESVSDVLVCDNVGEYFGKKITDLLNSSDGQDSIYYYELVPDDYKLYSFKP